MSFWRKFYEIELEPRTSTGMSTRGGPGVEQGTVEDEYGGLPSCKSENIQAKTDKKTMIVHIGVEHKVAEAWPASRVENCGRRSGETEK